MNSQRYIQGNKKYWDKLTSHHAKSKFYSLESFKVGKSSIKPLETREVGDVRNKKLLHLQCHFGMDSLSWERLGAKVTGVDISEESISLAKKLTKELNMNAKFIASDIYDLSDILDETYDVVYTSGGVLCWLPDIKGWAKLISHFLKAGGMFYLRDDHPFAVTLDKDLKVSESYFHKDSPIIENSKGSYATGKRELKLPQTFEWHHSLSDIVNALIEAGLKIKFLHEFPFLGWARFPEKMKLHSDGWFWFKDKKINIPLMFSLKAYK